MLNLAPILQGIWQNKEENYTVLYTCDRGYNCFRQVRAVSVADAMDQVRVLPPANVGIVIDAYPTDWQSLC